MKKGTHKTLLDIEKKSSKMEDDEWNDIDFHAKETIILCLSDEVHYNMMNEKTTAGFLCRLESFYMTNSLSNKLFMKKQLYSLQMKKGMPILQYLNAFNRILSDLLTLEVKLEEDKAILLLPSLPSSYNHLATTIIYGKEILQLEDVRQILPHNEMIKKADYMEEASGCLSRARGEDQKLGGPKRDAKTSSSFSCYICKNQGISRKII